MSETVKFRWGYTLEDLKRAMAERAAAQKKLKHPVLHDVIDKATISIALEALETEQDKHSASQQ